MSCASDNLERSKKKGTVPFPQGDRLLFLRTLFATECGNHDKQALHIIDRHYLVRIAGCLILLALATTLFFYRLADRDLWSSHEARAAQDAQTILLDHEWGLPRLFDRKAELQKPPLYYWLVAAVAKVRGGVVDEWAVRLPAALGAMATVLLLYGVGLARGRPLMGFLAACFLAIAVHFTWLARIGRIDVPLSFVLSLALMSFHFGRFRFIEGRPAWGWFLGMYGAIAAAVLLKGPIGLVLPAVVIFAFLLEERLLGSSSSKRGRPLHSYGVWWGVPLILAITLPWFFWANFATEGEFIHVFFWKHNVERGLGGGTLAEHPWWFYGPRLLFDFLPGSLLLPVAGWLIASRGWWRELPEARFGAGNFLATVLLLSCARFKRADYLLPAYPGAALMLGSVLGHWYQQAGARRVPAVVGLAGELLASAVGWCIHLTFVLPRQEPYQEFRGFAHEIRQCSPTPQLVLFFRVESHALAFHVGRPIDTIVEWENLDVWAGRPEIYHVVMPPECAAEWQRHLKLGQLEEVSRNTTRTGGEHAHPLVLLRTRHGG